MKPLYCVLCLVMMHASSSEEAHYTTDTQVLTIPTLIVDGSSYYEDVLLELNADTGQFTLLSSTVSEFPSEPQLLQIGFGETKILQDASSLKFAAVQSDSRCPLTVQCVTAGFVEIIFELQDGSSDQSFEIKLRLEGSGVDQNNPSVETNGLFFKLREVQPHPSTPQQIRDEDYRAVLEYSAVSF